MSSKTLTWDMEESLLELPILGIHTHLEGGHLDARGLHDVLLHHIAVSDLYAAGCPTGKRLARFQNFPMDEEADLRIQEGLPFPVSVENTSSSWAVHIGGPK